MPGTVDRRRRSDRHHFHDARRKVFPHVRRVPLVSSQVSYRGLSNEKLAYGPPHMSSAARQRDGLAGGWYDHQAQPPQIIFRLQRVPEKSKIGPWSRRLRMVDPVLFRTPYKRFYGAEGTLRRFWTLWDTFWRALCRWTFQAFAPSPYGVHSSTPYSVKWRLNLARGKVANENGVFRTRMEYFTIRVSRRNGKQTIAPSSQTFIPHLSYNVPSGQLGGSFRTAYGQGRLADWIHIPSSFKLSP